MLEAEGPMERLENRTNTLTVLVQVVLGDEAGPNVTTGNRSGAISVGDGSNDSLNLTWPWSGASEEGLEPPLSYTVVKQLQGVLVPLIFLFGLLGNLLAMGCFLSASLRTTSCCLYMAAKCCSDTVFLSAIFLSWLPTVKANAVHVQGVCQVTVYLSYVSGFTSVWLVLAITYENYIRLCRPHLAARHCSRRVALVVIAVIVALAALAYSFALWTNTVIEGSGGGAEANAGDGRLTSGERGYDSRTLRAGGGGDGRGLETVEDVAEKGGEGARRWAEVDPDGFLGNGQPAIFGGINHTRLGNVPFYATPQPHGLQLHENGVEGRNHPTDQSRRLARLFEGSAPGNSGQKQLVKENQSTVGGAVEAARLASERSAGEGEQSAPSLYADVSSQHPVCMAMAQFQDVHMVMTFVDTLMTLLLPSLLMLPLVLLTLLAVARSLDRKSRLRSSLLHGRQQVPSAASPSSGSAASSTRHFRHSMEAGVARFLLAVSLTFLFLHTPGHLIRLKQLVEQYILHTGYSKHDATLQLLFETLYYFNFCCSIVIFLASGANFRSLFLTMYCRRFAFAVAVPSAPAPPGIDVAPRSELLLTKLGSRQEGKRDEGGCESEGRASRGDQEASLTTCAESNGFSRDRSSRK